MAVFFFYISIIIVILLLVKSKRPQVVEVDQLQIEKDKVESAPVELLETENKLSDTEIEAELSELEESVCDSREKFSGCVDDDSAISFGAETAVESGSQAADEVSSGCSTGASTPRTSEQIFNPKSVVLPYHPLTQEELEDLLSSSTLGKLLLNAESFFDKSTSFTACQLGKILPTKIVFYLKKYF